MARIIPRISAFICGIGEIRGQKFCGEAAEIEHPALLPPREPDEEGRGLAREMALVAGELSHDRAAVGVPLY